MYGTVTDVNPFSSPSQETCNRRLMLLVDLTSASLLHFSSMPFLPFAATQSNTKCPATQSKMMGQSYSGHKKIMGDSRISLPCLGSHRRPWRSYLNSNYPSNEPSLALRIAQSHLFFGHCMSACERLLLQAEVLRKRLSRSTSTGSCVTFPPSRSQTTLSPRIPKVRYPIQSADTREFYVSIP